MNFKDERDELELEKSAIEFEEIEKEILQKEAHGNLLIIPKQLDEKMLQMIREFENIELKTNKRKRFNKYIRIASMIMICITATFVVVTINVDAFRIKIFDFVTKDNGVYMDVNIVEKGKLSPLIKEKFPPDWENVFYPMCLPQDYELVEAKNLGGLTSFIFSMKENKKVSPSFDYSPIGEWTQAIDSENAEVAKTKVNDNDAIYTSKEGCNILVWADSGYEFTLITFDIKIQETIKIAESTAYINLK